MACLRCLVIMVASLSGAAFDLWSPDRCDMCMDLPVEHLKADSTLAVGWVGCMRDGVDVPTCDVDHSVENIQAGGHDGAFFTLHGGKVAKRTLAFEPPASMLPSRFKAYATELAVYMNMWCLAHLRSLNGSLPRSGGEASPQAPRAAAFVTSGPAHALDPFVSGSDPWAARFFGICRVSNRTKDVHYMVLENFMSSYQRPSQLDLKVGFTIEPGNSQGWSKTTKKNMVDMTTSTWTHKARPAGYKVWDAATKTYTTIGSKLTAPYKSLTSTFDVFASGMSKRIAEDHLTLFGRRLEEMALWWRRHGRSSIRSYAASLLFIYEGALGEDEWLWIPPGPKLKFIDFAHFYDFGEKQDWPDDGVAQGMLTAMKHIDLLHSNLTGLEDNLGFTNVCGVSNACTIKCPSNSKGADVLPGVLHSRCRHMAASTGYSFAAWRTGGLECRLCNHTVPRVMGWMSRLSSGWHIDQVTRGRAWNLAQF